MNIKIVQLVPQEFCLTCDVCCRYTENQSIWAPFILKEEINHFKPYRVLPEFVKSYGVNVTPIEQGGINNCPFFLKEKNCCRIYRERPFDCQLYPFVISYNEDCSGIILGLDMQCPFVADGRGGANIENHINTVKELTQTEEMAQLIYENRGLIMPYNGRFRIIFTLEKASKKIFGTGPQLKLLSINDRDKIRNFFEIKKSKLFSYAFEYIYGWTDIACIRWQVIDNNLLILWEQAGNSFFLFPPIGASLSNKAIDYCKKVNKEYYPDAPKERFFIENACWEDIDTLINAGLKVKSANNEYIYESDKLIRLQGNNYKSQRWAYNYFKKNYPVETRGFELKDTQLCLDLYSAWAKERMNKYKDAYFESLIEDSFFLQRRIMRDFDRLNISGIVIEAEGKILGYSLGYPINKQEFCILAEIANLKLRGISQFLFREFCLSLSGFQYLNLMDDSGLENIRKAKLSYRPFKVNPIYRSGL